MQNIIKDKKIIYKIGEYDDKSKVFCTTHQMDNFYKQFAKGQIRESGVMNYIQHFKAASMPKKDAIVLDVCCGRSMILPLLNNHGNNIKKYIGLDISQNNLQEAKINKSQKFKCQWINGNATDLSNIIKEKIDFIIYTSAIEHMHPEDGIESIEECYKILKKGGLMFFSTPNNKKGYKTLYKAHIYEWGFQKIKNILKKTGFKIIEQFGLLAGNKNLLKKEIKRKYGQRAVKYVKDIEKYMPEIFFESFISIPFPEISKEILFILKK